jgi:hypothetical protein
MRSSAIKGADKECPLAVGITIRRVDDAVDVLAHQLAPFGIGNAPAADRRIQLGSRDLCFPAPLCQSVWITCDLREGVVEQGDIVIPSHIDHPCRPVLCTRSCVDQGACSSFGFLHYCCKIWQHHPVSVPMIVLTVENMKMVAVHTARLALQGGESSPFA